MKKLYCETCEAPLPTRQGRGQPRRYCSPACKQVTHRRRSVNVCEHCGQGMDANGRFCSDRCYYHGHKGIVPFERLDLAAFDEMLIPLIPRGQINAHDQNRPPWHARVYGGERSGR
jgi:hypothetical protein